MDRSGEMLAVARRRARRLRTARVRLVRADIRQLPFRARAFDLVMAPYGILQSLVRDADVRATLAAVHRVLARGAWFGIDLVPDVPRWSEYRNRVSLRGRSSGGSHLTLIESVRHERDRRLTIFDQEYVETMRDGEVRSHRFSLTFRTLSIAQITRRLENAGFGVEAVLGDYEGRPWDERADVWVIMARKR